MLGDPPSTTAATCCWRSTGSTDGLRARRHARAACPGWERRPFAPAAFVAGDTTPRPRPLGDDRPYVFTLAPDELDVDDPVHRPAPRRRDPPHPRRRGRGRDPRQPRRLRRAQVRDAVRADRRAGGRSRTPQRQQDGLSHAYHPWFPVLLIGSHKAELYTRALIGDIVHKQRNLSDPGWLVRVGIYLELLTCLGIAEAVGEDLYGRSRAAATSADRLNVEGWKRVWALREIAFGGPRTGPVGALNLLNKRRATLEFLHVHHEDLQHAIELAGPERPQRAGDVAPRVPGRRARRAAPDAGRVPGARPPAAGGAAVGALAPARPPRAEPRRCACPGRCRGCSATRTGCSRPPATSTGRR